MKKPNATIWLPNSSDYTERPRAWAKGLWSLTAAIALIVPSIALADVQSRFAGQDAGNWSQGGTAVGPSDGSCRNMGAGGAGNDTFDYSFDVPAGQTIVGVVVRPDAAQANDEQVTIQLLGNGGTLGNPVEVTWTDSGSGNCASSFFSSWGESDSLNFWGSPTITPVIVNSADFGVRLVKVSTGQTKVDSVCIDVYFSDGTGASSCESPSNTGTLRIVKNTTGNDSSFDFSVDTTPATTPSIATSSGTGSVDLTALEPQLYAVSELIPAGWDLVGASCDDGTSTAIGGQGSGTATVTDVNLNPGQTVVCTFVDSPEGQTTGSITVIKEVGGPTPAGDWSFTGFVNFDLPAGGGSQTFGDLSADTYTITETTKPGYTASVNCTSGESGENSVDVVLEEGENVGCTFVNTADPGQLSIVKKEVVGAAPGSEWSFTWTGGDGFTLPAAGGEKNGFPDLVPGQTYTVAEVQKPGYSVAAVCEDGEGEIASGSSSVSFVPEPGQEISCTFTNTEIPTSISIIKSVNGGDPVNDWDFEWTGGPNFSLDANGGSIILDPQGPGSYTITEIGGNQGYQVSVTCDGGETGTDSVTVEVARGEHALCEFVNSAQPAPPIHASSAIPALGPFGLFVTSGLLVAISVFRLRRRR